MSGFWPPPGGFYTPDPGPAPGRTVQDERMSDEAVAWLRQQIEGDLARWQDPLMCEPLTEIRFRVADCEAKLAILAEHAPLGWATYGDVCRRCRLGDDEPIPDGHHWIRSPCPTVRTLASAYRNRPGYAEHGSPKEGT